VLVAGGRGPGSGVPDDDVAAAVAIMTPGAARGCPGSSSKTVAVAAMSALTAMPDPLVNESMARPSSGRPGGRRHS